MSATAAYAQTDEADDMPDADVEPMFDEPVDLTIPWSNGAIDASKFTQGLPAPIWTSKAGIDYREGTPNAAVRPGHWLPGTTPEQAVGVAWANITAPGLMAWDKTALEYRASIPISRPASA